MPACLHPVPIFCYAAYKGLQTSFVTTTKLVKASRPIRKVGNRDILGVTASIGLSPIIRRLCHHPW